MKIQPSYAAPISIFVLLVLLQACGGGGDGGGQNDAGNTPPPSAPGTVSGTSYENFKAVGLTPQALPSSRAGVGVVRTYGNFSGSGRLDLFAASLTYSPGSSTPSSATPAIFEIWRKEANGSFTLHATIPSSGCIHPRKAIVSDFNGDTKPDVFVACHGYDAPPFPGERNKIVLSQPGGGYVSQDASPDVGFFHGAASADLNGDGRPDVVVVDVRDAARAFVLLNQGNGTFARETPNRLPSLGSGNYFTVELLDVDGDGSVDLALGGHEWEGAPTRIWLNPGTSNFSGVLPSTIPAVAGEGVVLDFTVTGSGSSRALWVLRTSGGDGTFYQSRTVQRVSWPSLSSSVPLQQRPGAWFQWLIPASVNGQSVVASEDAGAGVTVPQ